MLKTSARVLQLLSFLQARRSWSGEALAQELGVSARTVRNDIERLRDLGYAVDSSSGVAGGYRLSSGAKLPPLLLDNEEAVAIALGLASVAAGAIAGIEETSLRALMKLEQVMPVRVRGRVKDVQEAIAAIPSLGPFVNASTLSLVAAACRDNERLSFDYRNHTGASTIRTAEPHRVVHNGKRWYLVAWDVDRSDWRTFRIDRMPLRPSVGPRFIPRDPPDKDLVGHVSRSLERAPWRFRARVRVGISAAELSERVPAGVAIESVDDHSCIALVGSDSPQLLAVYLGMLGADFDVLDAPELRDHLRSLGDRYLRAAKANVPPSPTAAPASRHRLNEARPTFRGRRKVSLPVRAQEEPGAAGPRTTK